MMTDITFAEFARKKRLEMGMTLREFCRKHGYDVGNMSKYERGILAPPKSRAVLERYARCLGLRKGSEDWNMLFDLAALSGGRIPLGMTEDELLPKLPLVFRTITGQRLSPEKLREFAKTLPET